MMVTPATEIDPRAALAGLADANEWINDAYNAMTEYRLAPSSAATTRARESLCFATRGLDRLAQHLGVDESAQAARLVLPRIERAQQLLARLEVAPDERHLVPLLNEFDAAMDHLEAALGAAGWD
jgi:hypothetical protein